jgi:serine/threonine protein kinase
MVATAKGKKARARKARILKHRQKTILRKTPLILPIPIQFAEQLLPAKVKRILRYEIKGILGEGGFGKVYLAWDDAAKKYIALKKGKIKYMQKELDFLQSGGYLKNCHRFMCVTDAFKYKGAGYLGVDLVTGIPIADIPAKVWKKRGADIVKQIYEQIRFLHDEARIVHRDLSPQNILYDPLSGRITLIDFGISCQNDLKGKRFLCNPIGFPAESLQPKDRPSRDAKTEDQYKAADIYISGMSIKKAVQYSGLSWKSAPKLLKSYVNLALTYNFRDRLKKFYAFQRRV